MNIIETSNVGKFYFDTIPPTVAIEKVNLSIKQGEFVSIMGPSGSGKSTLLHILGLLDRPTEGDYKFFSKQVAGQSSNELANVLLPLTYSKVPEGDWLPRARAVIEAVGLSHRLLHETSELSGGEKQRTAIARALVTEPQIIFADEPTGNLDSKSGATVLRLFTRFYAEGKTVILITHDEKIARFAKRIIRVHDGRVVNDEELS